MNRCSCVIKDSNKFKIVWNILLIVFVVYSATYLPYRLTFIENDQTTAFDHLMNGFFIVDLIVNFLSSYEDPVTLQEVTDNKLIAINYLKTWFALDFLSTVPTDFFE